MTSPTRRSGSSAAPSSPSGEGLCIGYDGGDAVSSEYLPSFEFSGGTIAKVVFDVADDAYATSNATSRRRWRATSRDKRSVLPIPDTNHCVRPRS